MPSTSRFRTASVWLVVGLLSLLVAALLVVLSHPSLLTGRYYDFTVRSVFFEPFGNATIVYEDVLTPGTAVSWEYHLTTHSRTSADDDWGRRPSRFLRWPRKRNGKLTVWLTSEEERGAGMRDSEPVRGRLLLREGTYRVRAGERLPYYRRQESDGTVMEWHIQVQPSP